MSQHKMLALCSLSFPRTLASRTHACGRRESRSLEIHIKKQIITLKITLVLLSFFYAIAAQADCTFNITNYSDVPIKVKAGFYNGPEADGEVNIASSRVIKIKNALSCNSMSNVGFGVTYINLVGGKSVGGWVYDPSVKMIRAIGLSRISKDMVSGVAPSGVKLTLFNNARPSSDSFDVRIEKANRNISLQMGSMD